MGDNPPRKDDLDGCVGNKIQPYKLEVCLNADSCAKLSSFVNCPNMLHPQSKILNDRMEEGSKSG